MSFRDIEEGGQKYSKMVGLRGPQYRKMVELLGPTFAQKRPPKFLRRLRHYDQFQAIKLTHTSNLTIYDNYFRNFDIFEKIRKISYFQKKMKFTPPPPLGRPSPLLGRLPSISDR